MPKCICGRKATYINRETEVLYCILCGKPTPFCTCKPLISMKLLKTKSSVFSGRAGSVGRIRLRKEKRKVIK